MSELAHSSSASNLLPIALSEVLRVSLSEVIRKYFDGSSEDEHARRIGEAVDQNMSSEEGEAWLVEEAHRLTIELECDHEGGDDTF
jgi:hypothetical protein